MTKIVIVTPEYEESGTSAALCSAGLAHVFRHRGHGVHVVAAAAASPRPRYDLGGPVSLHRLPVRRGSGEAGFAVAACRRIFELSARGMCDVLLCVDAPGCAAGVDAMRRLAGVEMIIVSVSVDPGAHGGLIRSVGFQGSDAIVNAGHGVCHPGERRISFPLVADVWHPPAVDGPAFVVPGGSADEHGAVIEAFRSTSACRAGWSLLTRASDGCWSALVERDRDLSAGAARRIVLATGAEAPVAAVHAAAAGDLVLSASSSPLYADTASICAECAFRSGDVQEMGAAMEAAAAMDTTCVDSHVHHLCAAIGMRHGADAVAQAHEQLWSALNSGDSRRETLPAWRDLEALASAVTREELMEAGA